MILVPKLIIQNISLIGLLVRLGLIGVISSFVETYFFGKTKLYGDEELSKRKKRTYQKLQEHGPQIDNNDTTEYTSRECFEYWPDPNDNDEHKRGTDQ